MLQFKNETPYAGSFLVLPDARGIDTIRVFIKATFMLGETLRPADEQRPVALKDEYHGDPKDTSVRVPSDICLDKPGTDVLLSGSAHAPGGRPAPFVDVILKVADIDKRIVVFGDRQWERGIIESLSPPRPFTTIPLLWERAYGGTDVSRGDPPVTLAENRNPVGRGFKARNSGRKTEQFVPPNFEDPRRLIATLDDRPAPAGFAPVAPHWEPRRVFAGTYDEAWELNRAPFLPLDFDPRFFNLAPLDQITGDKLRGGETVEVRGATPDGKLAFRLPEARISVAFRMNGDATEVLAGLDTVHILADESLLILVWSASFPCDKKVLKVEGITARMESA